MQIVEETTKLHKLQKNKIGGENMRTNNIILERTEDETRFFEKYLEWAIEEIAEIIFLNLENEKKAKRIIQLLNARKSDIIEINEDYIIDETTLNFDDIFENTEEFDDQD